MVEIRGILTTTQVLENGFSHSLDDLKSFCECINKSEFRTMHDNHRPDLPPVGVITKCWVDKMPNDPSHYALYIEGELEDEVIQKRKGFSIAFFGTRCSSLCRLPLSMTGKGEFFLALDGSDGTY